MNDVVNARVHELEEEIKQIKRGAKLWAARAARLEIERDTLRVNIKQEQKITDDYIKLLQKSRDEHNEVMKVVDENYARNGETIDHLTEQVDALEDKLFDAERERDAAVTLISGVLDNIEKSIQTYTPPCGKKEHGILWAFDMVKGYIIKNGTTP